MNLPEGTRLAYHVGRECWYADANMATTPDPDLMIGAYFHDGGCAWEFMITEHAYGGGCIRVCIFSDAFEAFSQVGEFFYALCFTEARSLRDVRRLLDEMGAEDITKRTSPYGRDA